MSKTAEDDLEALLVGWEPIGVDVDAYLNSRTKVMTLAAIAVHPSLRKKGLGSKAMEDLAALADKHQLTIALTPSTDFGATSVSRLKAFYKRFGFVENKGRNRDFRLSESMYRLPR